MKEHPSITACIPSPSPSPLEVLLMVISGCERVTRESIPEAGVKEMRERWKFPYWIRKRGRDKEEGRRNAI